MNIRTIEFFLTVAEENSITRAAEILHISQPTVSRDIKELEKEIGKTLFIRTSKNVTLTPDGLLFRETARDMLALYRKAVSQRAEPTELTGDIYLGAGETNSFSFLAEMIRVFREAHPKVCFHIISENADEIRDDIDKGTLDFGFVMESGNLDPYERLEFDRPERWGVLIPEDHPLAGIKSVSARKLLQYPLILPENRTFQQQLRAWLGGEPNLAATYNLIRNALYLTRNGMGLIICLSDPSYREMGMEFIPLLPLHTVSPVLIWKKRLTASPVAAAFLEFLNESEDI